jgi:hypothetical protein
MLRYLADEDFDNRILRAIRRGGTGLDFVRVQDVGLSGCSDELVLQFATDEQRVVLSRDISTMPAAAYKRVRQGEPMPGVIVVGHRLAIGQAVDELVFLANNSAWDEWSGQVVYLPL